MPVLIGCFLVQMGLGTGYALGVTLKHIVAEFEWSRAAFSAGGAPMLLAMGLTSPLVGALTERIGARWVAVGAGIGIGTALWLFSAMESLVEFYLVSFLFGAALTGVGDIVAGSVATRWVTSGRGIALGAVFVGSNVGGTLVPVATDFAAELESWRFALRVLGVVAAAVIVPAAFLLREPPAPQTSGEGDAPRPAFGEDRDLDLRAALRTRSFWVLAFLLLTFYFYYLAINTHLVPFLSDIGFSNARAAGGLSFAVFLGIFAKLGAGGLAAIWGNTRILVLNFAVLTAASFLLLVVGSPKLLVLFLVAHGFAIAAENVVLPLAVVDCFGVRHLASVYGLLMMTLFVGGASGQLFAGLVFDRYGDYRIAFGTFAVLNLLGLLSLALLRDERAPRQLGWEPR